MNFRIEDDSTFRLSDLHPLELRFLQQATLVADPTGSPEAESRLYPDPLKGLRESQGSPEPDLEEQAGEDWNEFVVPGLKSHFHSALRIMERDLEQTRAENGWEIDDGEIIVPQEHAEQWYLALNQARLVMAERFKLHGSRDELFLNLEDEEPREAESPEGDHLREESPEPKIAILTIIQYEFYGKVQFCLMDLFL